MIRFIVGLGNPGRQYEKTRHNAGFLFVDRLAEVFGSSFSSSSRFSGEISECRLESEKLYLLKPSTFMNRSGVAVISVLQYYNLQPAQMLVVHDELDFNPGVVRLKKDGGHAGHNGLRDIIAHLGTKDFYRLRVGVGRPSSGLPVADYVLSEPSVVDSKLICRALDLAVDCTPQLVVGRIEEAMNKINALN